MTKFQQAIEATRPVFANQPSHETLKNSPAEKGAYEQLIQQVMDVNATYRSNAASVSYTHLTLPTIYSV